MRVDAAQAGERRAGQGEQVVHHRQFDLGDERQIVREQQVVVAVDAAADRVLERQDAVRHAARGHRVEDVLEAAAGDERRVVAHAPRGRLAERSRFALIRNLHRHARFSVSKVCVHQKGHHPVDDGPGLHVAWTTSSPLARGANDDGQHDRNHRIAAIRHCGRPSSQINNLYRIISSARPHCDTRGNSTKLSRPGAW